jgi:hypothetical protein
MFLFRDRTACVIDMLTCLIDPACGVVIVVRIDRPSKSMLMYAMLMQSCPLWTANKRVTILKQSRRDAQESSQVASLSFESKYGFAAVRRGAADRQLCECGVMCERRQFDGER